MKSLKLEKSFYSHCVGLALVLGGIVIAYQTTLDWMLGRYLSADSYYSHGFLIPVIALYFIYQQRHNLQVAKKAPHPLGLAIILVALFTHVLGTILYIFSVSGFSLFLLIIGLTIYFFGTEVFKTIVFPIGFLIFMFPIPQSFVGAISFPLKMIAAKAGVWSVSLTEIPIYGEGFNIFIPAGQLLVGNPCSGLRSLIAFLAMGSILAYLSPIGKIRKVVLFTSAIPIALLSNIIRIFILVTVSHYWGLEAAAADTFVHTYSGVLIFIIGFLLLILLDRLLGWKR